MNNVTNVVLYGEEAVAQLQADLDKCSTSETVVNAQNTQGIDLPSQQHSLSQQQDPIVVCQKDQIVSDNVTGSTISAADTTCAAALNDSCEAPASTCIGPNSTNVVTIDQHVHEKAGSMEEKDDVENGGDNQLLESSRKASPQQTKKPEIEFKGVASVEKPQDKDASQSISSDVETEEVNNDEMPLSKMRARVHKSGVIHISDMPAKLVAPTRTRVPELQQAFPGGQSFMDAGSFNRTATSDAYKDSVLNSKLRKSKRGRRASSVDTAESSTNARIRGTHVFEQEFVDALLPNGEVDKKFMWVCNVAMMADDGSKRKHILDQPTIDELKKPYGKCDYKKILKKVNKISLDDLEQLFLPTLIPEHWILLVVNFTREKKEIYDSLSEIIEGEDPHRDTWDTMGKNLQEVYMRGSGKSTRIYDNFQKEYPKPNVQKNNHDCGFAVLWTIQCYYTIILMPIARNR